MSLNIGTLSGIIDLDGNPFEKSLDRTMQSGAQRASAAGDKMTKAVTLPLVAAGGAALKLGIDFDTSMSRIVGLVGLSAEEVDGLRSSVMELSGETAKSPQELADALFTVTSAGFKGTEAMDVLTSAAKASAAGLGETRTIAEALTGAVNAYGPEVLTAARATDVLVATARAGNFESSQLAGVLGKITPFAKQAGASLEDVGGAIALLTRVNNNATESGTQVAAMMRAFVVPTEEAKKELDQLYGSTKSFRDLIAKEGLVAALQDLDGKLGGNREQLGKILGSSEAASAAFQILEADADTLAGTFGVVADSAGMTDEAFDAAANTSGFKLQQALAEVQATLIEFGDAIAPFAATVASGIGSVADAFGKLPGPAQTAIVYLAGLVAAIGPLLSIGGRLVDNVTTVTGWFKKGGDEAGRFSGKMGGLGKAAGAAAVGFAVLQVVNQWAKSTADNVASVDQLTGSLLDFADTGRATNEFLAITGDNFEKLGQKIKVAGNSPFSIFDSAGMREVEEANAQIDALDKSLAALYSRDPERAGEIFAVITEKAGEQGVAIDTVNDRFNDYTDAVAAAENEQRLAADAAGGLAGEAENVAGAINDAIDPTAEFGETAGETVDPVQELADAINAVTDAYRAQIDPFFAAEDALLKHRDAQEAVTDAEWAVIAAMDEREKAIREHGRGSREAMEATDDLNDAQRDLEDANRDAVRSALDVKTAQYELKRQMEEGGKSIQDAEAMLRSWVREGLITAGQARDVAAGLGLVAWNAGLADSKSVEIPVGLTGFDRVMAQLLSLNDLPNAVGARTSLQYRAGVAGAYGGTRHTGGRVTPDTAYLTGTYGHEELFVPDAAGQVFSHEETVGMLGGGRRGGSDTTLIADLAVNLDGRKIGGSRTVIEAIDTERAKRSRKRGER